ncbi:hypothetical protein LINPERPRIM_LOCUS14496 [Linum perenne]
MNGLSIKAFSDPWIPTLRGFKPSLEGETEETIWMSQDHMHWDQCKLRESFNNTDATEIAKIPIGPPNIEDQWVWNFTKDGKFSVKLAYHCHRSSDFSVRRFDRHISEDPAVDLGEETIVKTDCLDLVDALKKPPSGWPWQCAAWLHLMIKMMADNPLIRVSFIPRSLNHTADNIAKKAAANLALEDWITMLHNHNL